MDVTVGGSLSRISSRPRASETGGAGNTATVIRMQGRVTACHLVYALNDINFPFVGPIGTTKPPSRPGSTSLGMWLMSRTNRSEGVHPKETFVSFEEEIVVATALKEEAEMAQVFFGGLRVHKNIVNVHKKPLIKEVEEVGIHHADERRRGVG
jgi:hypothetical protein